ncbi:MAG: hypothetical protein LC800_09780 [Acidobacteria bacterium]|nr:hypothetical protein [Acidobacteriota bacterium]
MTKQVLKAFTAAAVFAALALFAAVGTARAQSPVQIRINVPFDFYVGDQLLPAGEYTVRRAAAGANNTLVVAGGGERAARQTSVIEGGREADATKLVFHRYADQHFLVSLWTEGERTGRGFRPSKRERAIRAEGARVAARGGNAEDVRPVVVEVAAGH